MKLLVLLIAFAISYCESDKLSQKDIDLQELSEAFKELKEKFEVERKVLKETMASMQSKIDDLKAEANFPKAPLNAVYVQYPFEDEPFHLWNCSRGQWRDISATYADMFFRVGGTQAASMGSIQPESSGGLQQVS